MLFRFGAFTDDKIVAALQEGADRPAFEQAFTYLYEHFKPKAIGYLLKNHQLNKEEAEEITSATLLILVDNIMSGQYKGQGKLFSYFMNILKNRMITWLRLRQRHEELIEQNDKSQSIEQQLFEKENRETLERLLGQLTNPKCRELLLWGENDTSEELALRLGYASTNVMYVARSRCNKDWIEILKKEGYI